MPTFAVYTENHRGQRGKEIKTANTPDHAGNLVRAQHLEQGGAVIILKIKAVSEKDKQLCE